MNFEDNRKVYRFQPGISEKLPVLNKNEDAN